jgi:calcium-dependent protein kinase
MSKVSGTPYYIAPEVLSESYDEKCDIWSCGVILYILLCGYPPFNGDSDNEIMKAVKKGKYNFPNDDWSSISKDAISLITSMLKFTPKDRPSAGECLSHSWFRLIDNQDKKSSNLSEKVIKNMKLFKSDCKLEQATVSFIINQLISKEERNELLSQFQTWDTNGDGVLSREEIYEGYKKLFGELKAEEEVVRIIIEINRIKLCLQLT